MVHLRIFVKSWSQRCLAFSKLVNLLLIKQEDNSQSCMHFAVLLEHAGCSIRVYNNKRVWLSSSN